MSDKPDLAAALADIAQGNVTTGLTFCLEQAIRGNDVKLAYSPALINAAAAALGSETREAAAKLKSKYGKEFSLTRFSSDVREYKAALTAAGGPSTRLLTTDNGAIKPVLANAILQLQSKISVGYDTFSAVTTILKPSPWGTDGPWRDRDDLEAANYLQHAGIVVPPSVAHDAALCIAHQNPYHPVRDWLQSLQWDEVNRLDGLLPYYFDTPDDEYARRVSIMWPLSAVARIMRPGCIAKYMIVLEGGQDEGKSKALRALTNGHLAGDTGRQWFRDNMPDLDHKDLGQYMQGVWIIEVAELSAIRGKQWEKTKAFISSPRDSFRAPYGRNMQDYPRQCIFAGTTNESQWGGDTTGLSRFWPTRPGKLRIDAILSDYEQLWAEAVARYHAGELWYGDAGFDMLARVEQDERAPEDSLSDRILATCDELLLSAGSDGHTVAIKEIMDKWDIIQKERHQQGQAIGRSLMRLGWRQVRVMSGGAFTRRYQRTTP